MMQRFDEAARLMGLEESVMNVLKVPAKEIGRAHV
jgi:hypothetical protein